MFDAESPWRFDTGVMIASEIIEVLKQHGVMPSKKLGQNFLCDANVARYHYPRIKPPCSRSVKHLSCFILEKNHPPLYESTLTKPFHSSQHDSYIRHPPPPPLP